MRDFIANNWSADGLAALPPAARIDRYRETRSTLGSLLTYGVVSATESAISVTIRLEKEGWLEFGFGFDEAPLRRIARISIQQTDDPDQPPVPPAASIADFLDLTRLYLDSLSEIDRFSGVVLVARHDSVLFTRACGYADRERKPSNIADTRFNIGSIN